MRETESRARGGRPAKPRAGREKVVMHPDQEAALEGLADALTAALGVPVKVAPRGAGCRVEMAFSNLGEARELVERLAAPTGRLSAPRCAR